MVLRAQLVVVEDDMHPVSNLLAELSGQVSVTPQMVGATKMTPIAAARLLLDPTFEEVRDYMALAVVEGLALPILRSPSV